MKLFSIATLVALSVWTNINKNHTPFSKSELILTNTKLNINAEESATLTGVLIKRPPTKSVESFCSAHEDGNSYVLKKADGNTVLLDLSNYYSNDIRLLVNREITVVGYTYTKTREVDNTLQQPMQQIIEPQFYPTTKGGMQSVKTTKRDYDCQIFYVEEMTYN